MFKTLFIVLEKIIYFTYKMDILLISYMSKKGLYLIFLFTFFFGSFGSTKVLSLEMSAFKYLCFLFAWYLIISTVFVFLSFQIPPVKRYLYKLLGETWVKEKIGNPGLEGFIKFGLAGGGFMIGNEFSKVIDGQQNREAGKLIWKNYTDMVVHTGKDFNPNDKHFKEAWKTSTEVITRKPLAFLDRVEERAATQELVKGVGKAWGDWMYSSSGKK